jgi:trans-2,3-dihydro-3-hydroxyanthranilate isomerase
VPVPSADELAFDVVDVFADEAFAGNQLAVVHDTAGLTDAQLLALTREFGFSETAFPSGGGDGDRYRVRIYTPGGEIPFAGHPTLGTAWVLRSVGLLTGDGATQVCGAGEIGVRFDGDLVELSADARDLSGPLPADMVALLLADLGLSPDDRTGEAWVAGAGLNFVHLPVRVETVGRAWAGHTPVSEVVAGLGLRDPLEGVNLYALDGPAVQARVFVPGLSVPEDPATGSAAAGLGMALVARDVLPDGGRYEITQGVEMGRPSRLFGRVDAERGVPTRCHVAGRVFPVARGTIAVPAP